MSLRLWDDVRGGTDELGGQYRSGPGPDKPRSGPLWGRGGLHGSRKSDTVYHFSIHMVCGEPLTVERPILDSSFSPRNSSFAVKQISRLVRRTQHLVAGSGPRSARQTFHRRTAAQLLTWRCSGSARFYGAVLRGRAALLLKGNVLLAGCCSGGASSAAWGGEHCSIQ